MRHRHLFARAVLTRTLASAMMMTTTGTSFSVASKSSPRWRSSMVVLTTRSRMHKFSPKTPQSVADFRDVTRDDNDATRRASYHGSPPCLSRHRFSPPPREGGHRCASIGGPPPALSPVCTMMMLFSRRYKKTKTKGGKGRKRSSSKEEEEAEENVDTVGDEDEDEDEEGVEITPFTIALDRRETAKAIEHLKLELGKLERLALRLESWKIS